MSQMRADSQKGIADDFGLDRNVDRGGEFIEDAAVLHVLAQKAESMACSLSPGDRPIYGFDVVPVGHEDISLPIQWYPANVRERLVFDRLDRRRSRKRRAPVRSRAMS